jgi:hypothetical protein
VHVPVPAVLLLLVYAAALAVALTDVGSYGLAGAVVLAGVTTRWALRHRRSLRRAAAVTAAAVEVPASAA